MQHLIRQRIRYLVEYGGIYPAHEPASKNFVHKWFAALLVLQALDLVLMFT